MFIFQFFIFLLQEVGEPGGHTTEYVAKKSLCHTVSYFSHLFFFFWSRLGKHVDHRKLKEIALLYLLIKMFPKNGVGNILWFLLKNEMEVRISNIHYRNMGLMESSS